MPNKLFFWSLSALAVVSACQSNTTSDEPLSAGAAGAGANRAMGGAGGQATAGEASHAGMAGMAGSGGTAHGGVGGGVGSGASSGSSGDVNAGSGRTSSAGASSAGASSAGAGASGAGGSGAIGDEGGQAGSTGQGPREFAYFAGLFKGVTPCELDLASGPTGGTPHVLQGSPVGSKQAIALTTDPAQRFLYVATQDGHIDSYRIAADGSLPASPSSSIQTPSGLGTITIDPKGRFIYAGGTGIFGYLIDADTGALSAIAGPPPAGGSYVAADPTGNFVYVSGQGLAGYRIDQTSGALSELSGSPFGTSGLPVNDIVLGGAIAFKPTGDFLYTTGAGPNDGALNAFAIEAGTGKLSLVTGSPFSRDLGSDANASNIAMDPQGQYLYVTSFATRHVSGFVIAANGKLTPVPGAPPTAGAPFAIGVEPSGRFVYIADDSGNNTVYALSRADGKLTEIMSSPFSFGGLQPEVTFAALP